MQDTDPDKRTKRAAQLWKSSIDWIRRRVPPGLRLVLGLLLVGGGIFGFLPILGFWMIPLGLAVIALDVKAMIRLFRRRG